MADMLEQFDRAPIDPTNEAAIERAFVERPCAGIELHANHLTRPDAFAKMLILGRLTASRELARSIDRRFTRSHRGYHMTIDGTEEDQQDHHFNDYISFNVGKTQALYASSKGRPNLPGHGGLGVTLPAEPLIADPRTRIAWGQLETYAALKRIRSTPLMEDAFRPLLQKTRQELNDEEFEPPKADFLMRVHLSRKAGLLTGSDQAEINFDGSADHAPEIPLEQVIVLAPRGTEAAILHLLRIKLHAIEPWNAAIERRYGIDLTRLTPERILERLPNLYWYPQRTIGSAVEFLSMRS